jgi:hypothetical protein
MRRARVTLTRLYTWLTAAAGDLPYTIEIVIEYGVTSENLHKLELGKPAKLEVKKQIHFPNFSLNSFP